MSQRIFKPDYKAFRETIDLISGYDIFDYDLSKYISYSGYIKISPLHDRLVRVFGFPDSTAPEIKPYKAMWAIFDDELLLLFVNAEINNQVFYTTDLVPEYPDELIMYNYTLFSGVLQLVVLDIEIKKPDIEFIDCESIMLFIHEGKLTNKILKPHKIRTSQSQPEIIEFRTKSPEQQIQTLLPEGITLPATDLAGYPRVWGGSVDMGAYEFNPVTIGESRLQTKAPARLVAAPNPFVHELSLTVKPKTGVPVRITVHNLLGREVARLLDQTDNRLAYTTLYWNGLGSAGENLPAGAYIISLVEDGKEVETLRVVKSER